MSWIFKLHSFECSLKLYFVMKTYALSIMSSLLLIAFAILLPIRPVHAAQFIYSKLQMKNYDQMQNEVNARVRHAESISSSDAALAKTELRTALDLIFSRPGSGNMVSELVPLVRTPLKNMGDYNSALSQIVTHAISNFKNNHLNSAERATGLIVLRNVMSELRPDIRQKNIQVLFVRIRNAHLKIPKAVRSELFLRGSISVGESPSKIAATILNAKPNSPASSR